MSTVQLSPHFTLLEATHSNYAVQHGLDNSPSDEDLATLKRTAEKMELVRSVLNGKPVIIYPNHSWYRNDEVNRAVGGVPTSQHRFGEAVDFTCPTFGPLIRIAYKLVAHRTTLQYDQLILEPSWIHISFCTSPRGRRIEPRLQYLDKSRG